MLHIHSRLKRGFTLLEILVAVALLGGLLVAVNGLLFSALSGARKAAAVGVVKTEGGFAMNAMKALIGYSQMMACAGGGGSLTVTRLNQETVTYGLSSERIASASAAGTRYLTSTRVRVLPCSAPDPTQVFSCSTDARTVEICFTVISSGASDVSDSDVGVFRSAVTIRNN